MTDSCAVSTAAFKKATEKLRDADQLRKYVEIPVRYGLIGDTPSKTSYCENCSAMSLRIAFLEKQLLEMQESRRSGEDLFNKKCSEAQSLLCSTHSSLTFGANEEILKETASLPSHDALGKSVETQKQMLRQIEEKVLKLSKKQRQSRQCLKFLSSQRKNSQEAGFISDRCREKEYNRSDKECRESTKTPHVSQSKDKQREKVPINVSPSDFSSTSPLFSEGSINMFLSSQEYEDAFGSGMFSSQNIGSIQVSQTLSGNSNLSNQQINEEYTKKIRNCKLALKIKRKK